MRWFCRYICISCLLGGFLTAAWAQQEVGMITSLAGVVRVKTAASTNWHDARLMMLCRPGDRLTVGRGNATVLFFQDGHRELISPHSELRLTSTTCLVVRGAKRTLPAPPNCQYGQVLKSASAQRQSRGGAVVLRGEGLFEEIILLTLSNTHTMEARPAFHWSVVTHAVGYQVSVWDELGALLWQQDTEALTMLYPATAPPLQPGHHYFWQVRARMGKVTLALATAHFATLPQATTELVQESKRELEALQAASPADYTPTLILATIYEKQQLRDDALATYQRLAQVFPHDSFVQEAIRRLSPLVRQDLASSTGTQGHD